MPLSTAYIGSLGNARHLARKLQPAGYRVIAFDPAEHLITSVTEGPLTAVAMLQELAENVRSQRIVLLDIPSSPTVDEILDELKFCLTVGDIVIHVQQALPEDTVRRARNLEAMQIYMLDCTLANPTTDITAGGNRFAFNDSLPLLQALMPGATYHYGGRTGTGHAAAQDDTQNPVT